MMILCFCQESRGAALSERPADRARARAPRVLRQRRLLRRPRALGGGVARRGAAADE